MSEQNGLKTFGTVIGTLVGLFVLCGLFTGAYQVITQGWKLFAAVAPQVKTLAAVATVVALVCALIIANGAKARHQPEIAAIAARAGTYEILLSVCCEHYIRDTGDSFPSENDIQRVTAERSLALYGSSKVISTYVKFRRMTRQTGKPDYELLNTLATQMRADLRQRDIIRIEDDVLDLLVDKE